MVGEELGGVPCWPTSSMDRKGPADPSLSSGGGDLLQESPFGGLRRSQALEKELGGSEVLLQVLLLLDQEWLCPQGWG